MIFKSSWSLLKDTVSEFMEDKALRLSAAMAYYSIFAIGPLLLVVIGIAGLALGEEKVKHEVGQQLQGAVGQKAASMLQQMMTAQQTHGKLIATIIGAIALVFGAAGLFGQLQDALNTIWGVTSRPGQGIWGFIRQRFLSMAMVFGVGFLLLVSMALSAAVSAFSGYLGQLMSLPPWTAQVFEFAVSLLVITVLFAAIFKALPDVKIKWRDVWIGAFGTALLFTIGKFLLGLYLKRGSMSSAYGAGSALIIVIMYIYYAAVILFFGAEFTQVYARHKGRRLEPSKHAVALTDEQRAHEGIPRDQKVEEAARRTDRDRKPQPTRGTGDEKDHQTRVE